MIKTNQIYLIIDYIFLSFYSIKSSTRTRRDRYKSKWQEVYLVILFIIINSGQKWCEQKKNLHQIQSLNYFCCSFSPLLQNTYKLFASSYFSFFNLPICYLYMISKGLVFCVQYFTINQKLRKTPI